MYREAKLATYQRNGDGVSVKSALRRQLEDDELLVLPGVVDAMTARVVEDAGFGGVYVTGAGFANASFGIPDVGLVTATDLSEHVRRIADVVDIPVVVDADTGYGGVLNVWRTVRELERAGAAAIQIEDQAIPKRCGHFDGQSIVTPEEMVQRLAAAVDARQDPDLVIVARTDAYNTEGVDAAISRAKLYVAAGADALFIEAPTSREDLLRLPGLLDVPVIANMVEGGKTPLLSAQELQDAGFGVALYANTALRSAMYAVREAMNVLRDTGDTSTLLDSMLSWDERQKLAGLPYMQALEAKFVAAAAAETTTTDAGE